MKRIVAFGDSFVVGDQDDFGPKDINYNPKFPPTHTMSYEERMNYLKYNVSFVSIIANELNYSLLNLADRGNGNYQQLDVLLKFISSNQLTSNDIIFYGITTTARDRIKPIIDRGDEITREQQRHMEVFDLFYILAVLNQISQQFNVRIIKFNLFENILDNLQDFSSTLVKCNVNDFPGYGDGNNTLVDILNDTWGKGFDRKPYHTYLSVPDGYEKYYTWNKHPSIAGHQKIAAWFLNNITF